MNRKAKAILAFSFFFVGCPGAPDSATEKTPVANVVSTPAQSPDDSSPTVVRNGDYPATGKVTKINSDLGSVEMDHEEIVGIMPAMRMEFYVSDKKLLDGLKVGDRIDFTLRYKDRTETITAITKSK